LLGKTEEEREAESLNSAVLVSKIDKVINKLSQAETEIERERKMNNICLKSVGCRTRRIF
jgi:hypothetical protein